MSSTVITDYVGRGLHVDRPVSPPISSGATAIYFETDTNTTFVWSGSGWIATFSGAGTVTSVAMTVPGELSLTGSPITSSGTFALSWSNETGNVVLASPSAGGSGVPAFRNLVAGDIPNLDTSKITTGILAAVRGGTGLNSSTAGNGQLFIGNGSGLTLSTLTAGSNVTITNGSGTITIASTGGGGGGGSEAIPGGYLSAFMLKVHNGFTSTIDGSTTTPVLTNSTDYVVQSTFTGSTATEISSGVLDTVDFTDVAVFYNNAGTWQQIDIDYDVDTNGAWSSSNVTLWFKLQTPILAGADSPTLGSGSYILCYGHTVPIVMRNWENIYPLSDDFPGSVLDTAKWQAVFDGAPGNWGTVTVSGSAVRLTVNTALNAAVESLASFSEGYQYRSKSVMSVPVYAGQAGFAGTTGAAPQSYFAMYFGYLADTWFLQNYDGTTNNVTNFSATMDNSYHVLTLNRAPSTGQVSGSILGETESVTPPGGTITGPLVARVYAADTTGGPGSLVISHDWIKVRPWVSTEPTVTATAIAGTGKGGDTTITELLFYSITTDVLNNFIPTNGVWTDVFADQSFTIVHSTSIVEYLLFGIIYQGTQYGAVRLLVDGVTPYHIAGGTGSGTMCLNCRIPVTGLSAGAHTIKAQIFTNSGSGFYLRAASNESEFFDLHVLELF